MVESGKILMSARLDLYTLVIFVLEVRSLPIPLRLLVTLGVVERFHCEAQQILKRVNKSPLFYVEQTVTVHIVLFYV